MYKLIIRPILFLLQPETVHHLVVAIVRTLFYIPGVKFLTKYIYTYSNPQLEKDVFGLRFKNPVGLAAGFDKNAEFFNQFSAFGFSFIEIGTVTPKGQAGNPKPRSFRLKADKALINRMGFNNKGVINTVKNLKKRKPGLIVGGNIGKNTLTPNNEAHNDYFLCFKELYDYVDYFVVNVSCPNIANLNDLQNEEGLRAILSIITDYRNTKPLHKPILLKVSPDLNDQQLEENIHLAQEYQLDGFVATNTTTTRRGLSSPEEIVNSIGNGGLSGKPIKDRSTEVIRMISQKTKSRMPIIGVGGIMNEKDAMEKIAAGASLLQVYTGFIYEGPGIVKKICKALINK